MIRPANFQDIPAIVEIVKAGAADTFGGWKDERGIPLVQSVIGNSKAFVLEHEGTIAASLGLEVSEWWTSGVRFLGDRWLGVHPEFRRLGYGTALIEFAKHYTDNTDLPLVLGVSSLMDVEAKMELFAQHMTPFGGLFYYKGNA